MAKKTATKRYADPTTGTYVDIPLEKATETTLEAPIKSEGYQDYPKAIKESLARPESVLDTTNDELNQSYPWCVSALTTPQRAILCELIRIRKALEAK